MVKKISIIGSGGVGAGVAYHTLANLQPHELVLVDISGDLAKGVALDLEDTRAFLHFQTKITGTKNLSTIRNSDIVVITAGVARKEGMTRLDLLSINAKIAKELGSHIKKFAPFSVVIVVTNPLDIITYIVGQATGFDRTRVLGMGSSLDTARLINLFAKETALSTSVLEALVFGFHSKDMIASPDRLRVKNASVDDFLSSEQKEKVTEHVKGRGAQIVGFLKTRSAHFAPSLSAYRLLEAVAQNKNEVIPVSVLLAGEYGLKDLCMGIPCVINRKGIDQILPIELSQNEKQQLQKVKEAFKDARQSIKAFLR